MIKRENNGSVRFRTLQVDHNDKKNLQISLRQGTQTVSQNQSHHRWQARDRWMRDWRS